MTVRTGKTLWRIAVSHVLVFLTAWLSLAPVLHGAGHDRDCDPALLLHDASQHRLTAAAGGSSDGGDHCVACHLFRSSRHVAAWKFVPQALDASSLARPAVSSIVRHAATVPLPARAPPALS